MIAVKGGILDSLCFLLIFALYRGSPISYVGFEEESTMGAFGLDKKERFLPNYLDLYLSAVS